eukprot:2943366-Pyramimonas_sp.AAC.1
MDLGLKSVTIIGHHNARWIHGAVLVPALPVPVQEADGAGAGDQAEQREPYQAAGNHAGREQGVQQRALPQ